MKVLFGIILALHSYILPVHYEVSLAGNFGEPRPHHFHGGIDIRTSGVEGKPIYTIGDGYVSRVSVGLYGFGNAVYVHHPDGRTSVYCHLKSFSSRIKRAVRHWQHLHQSYRGDMFFAPTDLPVAQGDFIALSGNTGHSMAPHLHLEIHDSKTWNMLDPLEFLGQYVSDNTAPVAHGLMAYPQNGSGSFCGSGKQQNFAFAAQSLAHKFTAWGQVGFGIWANDYMENSYNHYGVRSTQLMMDGKLIFESNVDEIPMEKTRMADAWGDYAHFLRSNVWYMKSFIEPGLSLPVLKSGKKSGIVDFTEERDYHFTYVLTDFFGNSAKYSFVVMGKKEKIEGKLSVQPMKTLFWNRPNYFVQNGASLLTRSGALSKNLTMKPRFLVGKSSFFSDAYQFYPVSFPLFSWAKLGIKVKKEVKYPEKLYVTSLDKSNRFFPSRYEEGWVYCWIRDLGLTYTLAYDDLPPSIVPVAYTNWTQTRKIKLTLHDKGGSGIKSVKAFLDGRFILLEPLGKSAVLQCDLGESPVPRTGQVRTLRVVAVDNCGNENVFETKLKY